MPRPVKDGPLRVGGRTVQVSSVAKPFFPEIGLTKGDLLAYYRDVAEVMLPHLRGRPLNLQRFPNGVDGAVTFHARTSTVDHLARPDLVVIDLDPDQGLDVVRAACDEVGLVPFAQTSGSRGVPRGHAASARPDVELVRDSAAELARPWSRPTTRPSPAWPAAH